MAVVLQQQGTVVGAVTTGNLTVNFPAYAADDIVVITTVGYVPNTTTGTNTQTLASPWTKYTPNVTTITGGIIDNEFAFWWARATSVSSLGTSVTITRPTSWDTGNDTVWAGRAYVIRGCVTTGNPFDQLVASAISTASNPPLPAVNVSGAARLVISFYVASDNLQAPTAASGYTVNTSLTTATGTDAGFQSYQDLTDVSVSAVTPSGGATSAQNFQVYFSASFAPEPATLSRTATGFGTGTESADGFKTLDRTATGSGLGDGSGDDQLDHQRTADGSGAGTQSAAGSILAIIDRTATGVGSSDHFASGVVPVTYSRTASGAGSGTQTAVWVKGKRRTAASLGAATNVAANLVPFTVQAQLPTANWAGQTFLGNGKVLDSITVAFKENGTTGVTGTIEIYAHTGTFNTSTGKPTGSPLASATAILPAFNNPTYTFPRFVFTGSNRIVLENGTPYVFVVRCSASVTLIYSVNTDVVSGCKVATSNSGSTWTVETNSDFTYAIFGADATGVSTRFRTATGSGTGTESASGAIVVLVDRTASGSGSSSETATSQITPSRTATGSGTGTETATASKTLFRTAVGSGLGTSTADTLHNNIRSASGSGAASPSGLAVGLVTAVRTATGSGSGTSTSFGLHVHIETGTGSGLGSSTAVSAVYRTRTATGSGLGSSSTTTATIKGRSGAGSGIGTSVAIRIITFLKTATGSGIGTSFVVGARVKARIGLSEGFGTSSSEWYKSLIFRPPFDGEFRWAEYGATDSTSMFFGRMRPGQKASNIYKMVDGTYTTIPSRDYSIVSKVYHGGHENLVTPEEKADLIAAGYGDYVT